MRRSAVLLVAGAMACGGGPPDRQIGTDTAAAARTPAATADTMPAAPVPVGRLHEVRMVLTPDGRYQYEPAQLTISRGDRVRWVNLSGGPHNVAFYENRVPQGAAALLRLEMRSGIGDLAGAILFQPNATYDLSFAGMPTGTYAYYCTPHETAGMTGQLTVVP